MFTKSELKRGLFSFIATFCLACIPLGAVAWGFLLRDVYTGNWVVPSGAIVLLLITLYVLLSITLWTVFVDPFMNAIHKSKSDE